MNRIVSQKEFIGCVVGVIYRQAPNNKPRDIDKIVDYINDYFFEHADLEDKCSNRSFSCLRLDDKNTYEFVHDIMFGCQEFLNLNLSQYEIDNGIGFDDENRGGFVAVDAYTKIQSYYDFVDLDACVRNIANSLWDIFTNDDLFEGRLFLCKKNNKGEFVLESETLEELENE